MAGRATRGAKGEWPRRVVSRPLNLVPRYQDYDSARSRYGCVVGTPKLCSMESSFTLLRVVRAGVRLEPECAWSRVVHSWAEGPQDKPGHDDIVEPCVCVRHESAGWRAPCLADRLRPGNRRNCVIFVVVSGCIEIDRSASNVIGCAEDRCRAGPVISEYQRISADISEQCR